ncbi:unnamed protein product [Nezara viridula]|uniref:Neuropeptide n=1 Tax=Nezara viridula TaxID=85310 RepID=A0A9P0HT40_NEZVI|nr:unnamed protein product [Nezara viridula]
MLVNYIGLGVLLIVGLSAICRAGVIQDQDILDILGSPSKECTECSPQEAAEIDKNDNILEEPVKDESLDELESEEAGHPRRKRSRSDSDDSSDSNTKSDSSDSSETREKKEKKERDEKRGDSENFLSQYNLVSRIGRSV